MPIVNKSRKWQPHHGWSKVREDDLVVLHDGTKLRVIGYVDYAIVGDCLRAIGEDGQPRLLDKWEVGGIYIKAKEDAHLEQVRQANELRLHALRYAYCKRYLGKPWLVRVTNDSGKYVITRALLESVEDLAGWPTYGGEATPHPWKRFVRLTFDRDIKPGERLSRIWTEEPERPLPRWVRPRPMLSRVYDYTPATIRIEGVLICPDHGEWVTNDSTFCPACVEEERTEQARPDPNPEESEAREIGEAFVPDDHHICPECGAVVHDFKDVCPTCGAGEEDDEDACEVCNGAGYDYAHGDPPILCAACDGTGKQQEDTIEDMVFCAECDFEFGDSQDECPQCGWEREGYEPELEPDQRRIEAARDAAEDAWYSGEPEVQAADDIDDDDAVFDAEPELDEEQRLADEAEPPAPSEPEPTPPLLPRVEFKYHGRKIPPDVLMPDAIKHWKYLRWYSSGSANFRDSLVDSTLQELESMLFYIYKTQDAPAKRELLTERINWLRAQQEESDAA